MGIIIGLTVHDNDYGETMERFAGELGSGRFIMEESPETEQEKREWYYWYWKTDKALRAMMQEPHPTEEQKDLLVETIKRSWRSFVDSSVAAAYLSDALEVTLPETIDAAWGNGEQYYVFPSSYAGKVLCF